LTFITLCIVIYRIVNDGIQQSVTIVGVLRVRIVLTLDHVWKHVAVAPPTAAKLRPLIVVVAIATDECQVVDTGRAAEAFASWVCQLLFHTQVSDDICR